MSDFAIWNFNQVYIFANSDMNLYCLYQVDFNLPERFDITYVDSKSEKKRPIMIHRAVLGSLERFFGVLIEHYAGDFPLWLSPVQARVLPVTDTQVRS